MFNYLSRRAPISKKPARDGKRPLYLASELGLCDAAELLLKYYVGVESFNSTTGVTALHVAVTGGHSKTVEILLEYGADRLWEGPDGRDVLTAAQGQEGLLNVLRAPPVLRGPSIVPEVEERDHPLPKLYRIKTAPSEQSQVAACTNLRATIVDFLIDDYERRIQNSASIHDLLYGDGPEAIMANSRTGSLVGKKQAFRWYHLPANNVR